MKSNKHNKILFDKESLL